MGKERLRLVVKMARHRPAAGLGSVALALILVFTVSSMLGAAVEYKDAVERGARASFGTYSFQVAGNDDVHAYMQSLERKGEAVAIAHSQQNVLSDTGHEGTTADVTRVSGPADIGVLMSGRYPQNSWEATLSSETARQAGVAPGDGVDVVDPEHDGSRRHYQVVGITEDPASVRDTTMVALTHEPAFVDTAEIWLTDDDLAPIYDVVTHGGGDFASSDSAVARAADNAVTYQAISPQLAWVLGGFMVIVLLLAAFAADRQRRANVYRVLVALGDRSGKAALTTCAQTTLLVLLGGVLGVAVALASFPLWGHTVAARLEQRWATTPWPAMSSGAVAILAVTGVAGLVTAGAMVWAARRTSSSPVTGFSRKALLWTGIVGAIVTLLFIVSRQLLIIPLGYRGAMIVGALSVPALGYALGCSGRKRKLTVRMSTRLQKLSLGALAVVFAFNYDNALYSSTVEVEVNGLAHQIEGVSSYLRVGHVNHGGVAAIFQRYPDMRERSIVLGDVSTSEKIFRITNAEGSACFRENQSEEACPRAILGMVYVATQDNRSSDYVNNAPPDYVEQMGKVNLVAFPLTHSGIEQLAAVDGIYSNEDLAADILGGIVLDQGAPVLQEIGAGDPQFYTIVVPDFAGLPDEVRNGVRSTVLAEAPFAMVVESDDPGTRQLRAQSVARQIIAVILSGALLLALISTLVADQRLERRLVELGGGSWRTRLRLARPLLWSYAVTVTSAVVLGRLTAMHRIPFTYLDLAPQHDYGVVWALGLAGLLFLISASYLAARRPAEDVVTE